MPAWPITILALLIGVAGWYYLFYSRAAQRLNVLEANAVNGWRVRLRRANGAAMIFLGALLYIGTRGVDSANHPNLFVACWLSAMVLLLAIVGLALVDIRLTVHLRRGGRHDRKP